MALTEFIDHLARLQVALRLFHDVLDRTLFEVCGGLLVDLALLVQQSQTCLAVFVLSAAHPQLNFILIESENLG